jgi:hypothetical protein
MSSRVGYWYFQFSSAATQDVTRMLRSILRQLICSPLPVKVQEMWDNHYQGHTEPPDSELLDATEDVIGTHEHVFLVLDALDEYPEDKSPGRSALLETILKLLTISHGRLHLVVTSRREPDIRKVLQPMARFSINVDQALEIDVEKFVNHALSSELIKRWGTELVSLATYKLLHSKERYAYLIESIFVKTEQTIRRFRWTDLQIKRLRVCPTTDDFRDALNTLPKSLEETYHQALETIPDAHRKRMRRVLIWLTSSLRELTSSEVAAVIAFPFVEDVLRVCTSVLITVIDGNTQETIKLAHFTVKEFLIIQEGFEVGLHWYRFSAQLANRCVTAEAIDAVFGSHSSDLKNILGYASQYWPAHARQLHTLFGSASCDEVQSRIDTLFEAQNRKPFLHWLKAWFPDEASFSHTASLPLRPMYYASLLGLRRSVEQHWTDCSQLDQQEGFYGNSLDAAACMGHADVVMWLTDRLEIPSNYFDLPLILWCLRVNIAETLRALLRKPAKLHINTEAMLALTMTPVGEEMLKILLEEKLVAVSITEDLVLAAAHNKCNGKIIEFLVRGFTRQFPISLRALLTVAETSLSALQMLIDIRKGDICFNERDYMEFRQEGSTCNLERLLHLGVSIPVTTELIRVLASSSCGSRILRLLLRSQTIEHSLTRSDVLTVAGAFDPEILQSLSRHEWVENTITEELILAIAFNCYLDPPIRSEIPQRDILAGDFVHHRYRTTLRQSTMRRSSTALISLMKRKKLDAHLLERTIARIVEQFEKEVLLHLVNTLAGAPICGWPVSSCDYAGFSSILRTHASHIGVSPRILQALDDGYKLMCYWPLTVQKRYVRSNAAIDRRSVIHVSAEDCLAAVTLGLGSLPSALCGLDYSTSEYDGRYTIRVQKGWRAPYSTQLEGEGSIDPDSYDKVYIESSGDTP